MINVGTSPQDHDFNPGMGREVQATPAQITGLQAELMQLRGELEQLRGDRARLLDRQRRMMELIGTKHPEHLVHDMRNVLNERELLRTLVDGKF